MQDYSAPIRDMQFLIHEVLEIERYSDLPGYSDASRDLIDALLVEAEKWHRQVLAPLNRVGDTKGCQLNADGSVTTPEGFKQVYDAYAQMGFGSLSKDPAYGGQGLPLILGYTLAEMSSAANHAFTMYIVLSGGAWRAIHKNACEELKNIYLPPMTQGRWTGTMNLTEPQCGTDLGLIQTKATPQEDGSYKISGQKIWISSGEHDLADNIVHLVLARAEGAPQGIKGLSLFIVPKYLVKEDGSLGERNRLSCGGLEKKMGIHGNATCVMNYDGATGYLVGEPNRGMRAMFIMMNEARLGVGMQAYAIADAANQNAVAFARDRLQSRSLSGPKHPDKPADPIIVHPDVRRMLMDNRVFIEGARALTYWTAIQEDIAHKSDDPELRQRAEDYTALLTPVIKAFQTHKGHEAAHDALQVFGGSGYVEEWGMSQYVRDTRISMIYEGTNGIQALDLVGRKLMANGGRAWRTLSAEIDDWCAAHTGHSAIMDDFIQRTRKVKSEVEEAINWLAEHGLKDLNNAGAASHDFLHLFAHLITAYMWLLMAHTAQIQNAKKEEPFYAAKLISANYFFKRSLAATSMHLEKLKTGAEPIMALSEDAF